MSLMRSLLIGAGEAALVATGPLSLNHMDIRCYSIKNLIYQGVITIKEASRLSDQAECTSREMMFWSEIVIISKRSFTSNSIDSHTQWNTTPQLCTSLWPVWVPQLVLSIRMKCVFFHLSIRASIKFFSNLSCIGSLLDWITCTSFCSRASVVIKLSLYFFVRMFAQAHTSSQ